jgi:hypothetical protein
MGVARLESDAVIMISGTRVPVGAKFSSGETLIHVDPVNGRIQTDRRTILVL